VATTDATAVRQDGPVATNQDPWPTWQVDLAHEAATLIDVADRALVDGSSRWLTDSLGPDATMSPQLWIATRTSHCLSLGVLLKKAHADRAAEALRSIDTDFADITHGGWFDVAADSGQNPNRKTAYGHAFVMLAAASALIAEVEGAADLLERATHIVEAHFWDESTGAMRESFNDDWSETEAYRGANANMHAIEAFLAVGDATNARVWTERAVRIAQRIVSVARTYEWCIPEHFAADWTVDPTYNADQPRHQFRPPGVTPGHAVEWARLLVQLWARDHTLTWALDGAQQLFDRAVRDGWQVPGGLPYTTTFEGIPVVTERFHWVQCELAYAAEFLWRATGFEQYADWRAAAWQYIWPHFPDRELGGWRHELDSASQPSYTTWVGKPDVYHALQACLSPRLALDKSVARSLVEL